MIRLQPICFSAALLQLLIYIGKLPNKVSSKSNPKCSPTVSASKSTFSCHNINNHHYLQQHCDDHEKVISPCPCQDRPPCPCWTQQLPTSKDADVNKLLQNLKFLCRPEASVRLLSIMVFVCINPSSKIFTWIFYCNVLQMISINIALQHVFESDFNLQTSTAAVVARLISSSLFQSKSKAAPNIEEIQWHLHHTVHGTSWEVVYLISLFTRFYTSQVQDSSINSIFCRTLVGITDSLRYVITIMNQSKNYLQIPNTAVLNQTHPHPCQMEQTTSWSIASIWLLMKMQLEPLQSRWLNMLNIDVWVSVRAPFCKWGVPSHLLSPGHLELAPPWDCGSPTCVGVMSSFFWGDEAMGIIIAQIDMKKQKRNMFWMCLKPPLHLHQIIIQINSNMPKLCHSIYAQIMATHSCLQNGCSFGFSVFLPAKNDVNRVSKRCLRHVMEPLQVVHELEHTHDTQLFHFTLVIGSVLLTHYTQHHIVQFSKIQEEI